ncbi:hypothetical protein QBC36DRAFT_315219 [Triangularia setosa]|uniref:Uncharacterized protein n=1 Tax=Triangularia setosa TaxID=2587417 RepID=A0AAN7A3N3_9PEZI|nr:hypothetical protein QBC36DRAFT_315219 [Podospora setosa]
MVDLDARRRRAQQGPKATDAIPSYPRKLCLELQDDRIRLWQRWNNYYRDGTKHPDPDSIWVDLCRSCPNAIAECQRFLDVYIFSSVVTRLTLDPTVMEEEQESGNALWYNLISSRGQQANRGGAVVLIDTWIVRDLAADHKSRSTRPWAGSPDTSEAPKSVKKLGPEEGSLRKESSAEDPKKGMGENKYKAQGGGLFLASKFRQIRMEVIGIIEVPSTALKAAPKRVQLRHRFPKGHDKRQQPCILGAVIIHEFLLTLGKEAPHDQNDPYLIFADIKALHFDLVNSSDGEILCHVLWNYHHNRVDEARI